MINWDRKFNQAIKIIDSLLKKSPQFQTFIENPIARNWTKLQNTFSLKFFYGASKGVIIPKRKNFVLKFNFINPRGVKLNWCNLEADIYKEAVFFNIDKMFAPCRRFTYRDITFVIMVRADTDFLIHYKDMSYLDAKGMNEDGSECLEPLRNLMNKYHGYGCGDALINFCKEYEINDFHSENIGWRGGKPILIDYSGFMEDS